jgi:hypothetical protein
MEITLAIKFEEPPEDFLFFNNILKIPECSKHHIHYDRDSVYRHQGNITYLSGEFLTNIVKVFSDANMSIVELEFKIK